MQKRMQKSMRKNSNNHPTISKNASQNQRKKRCRKNTVFFYEFHTKNIIVRQLRTEILIVLQPVEYYKEYHFSWTSEWVYGLEYLAQISIQNENGLCTNIFYFFCHVS